MRRHYANCYLDVFPHGSPPIRIGPAMRPNPVVSASYGKQLDGPFSGSSTITLRETPGLIAACGGQAFSRVVTDDDWLILYGGDAGGASDIALLLVDRVVRRKATQGNAPVVFYDVSARDIGKVFDDTTVWFSEWGKRPLFVPSQLFEITKWAAGSPSQICKGIVDGFLSPAVGDDGMWQMPASIGADVATLTGARPDMPGVSAILDTDTYVEDLRGIATMAAPIATTYNLAAFLREWANPALNEMFVDLRAHPSGEGSLAPALVLRECPFPVFREAASESAWARLPAVFVPETDVLSSSIGTMNDQRYTAFTFQAQSSPVTGLESFALYPPLYAPAAVRKHGLKLHEIGTRYAAEIHGGDLAAEPKRWRWLLQSWFGPLAGMLSGTITLRGFNPDLRIGRKLVVGTGAQPQRDPSRETYYIRGVSLDWGPDEGWETTVDVSRGYVGDDAEVQRLLARHFDDLLSVISGDADRNKAVAGSPKDVEHMRFSTSKARDLGLEPTSPLRAARDVLAGPSGATVGGRSAGGRGV